MRMGLAREAVRRTERLPPDDFVRVAARVVLGQALMTDGKLGEAKVLLRDMLAIRLRVDGPTNPSTRYAASLLGMVLHRQSQDAEAVALYRLVLSTTPTKEQDDENTVAAKCNLASSLQKLGAHAEAEALLRGAVAAMERLHGPLDALTFQPTVQLADLLGRQGRYSEAEALYRPTLAGLTRVLGPQHPFTVETTASLVFTLALQGEHAEAEKLRRVALAGGRKTADDAQ